MATSYKKEGQSTVIIGAGIIGCATAHYLSSNANAGSIHLIEASPELFASASGKAGGFCTADWFGPPTASLGALSFKLHQELADQYDGCTKWGYRRSTASSFMEGHPSRNGVGGDWLGSGGSRAEEAADVKVTEEHKGAWDRDGPGWLVRTGGDSEVIGNVGGVAQVDPLRLSQFLLDQSIKQGVQLHHPAKATRLSSNSDKRTSSITIQDSTTDEEKQIPCTRVLIAAGAWTPSVIRTLFPSSPLRLGVSSLAGYSIVVRSPRWTKELEKNGCHAIFTSMRGGISPEIFSRFGGEEGGSEIYIAGLNDVSLPLPELASDAVVEKESNAELHRISQKLLGKPGADPTELEILKEGLCFRPVTRRGVPIMAKVPDAKLGADAKLPGGLFIAAGHGPWGISHSLGTGKVMAEMLGGMSGGRLSADVRSLGMQ